jgi:hypothetical protein
MRVMQHPSGAAPADRMTRSRPTLFVAPRRALSVVHAACVRSSPLATGTTFATRRVSEGNICSSLAPVGPACRAGLLLRAAEFSWLSVPLGKRDLQQAHLVPRLPPGDVPPFRLCRFLRGRASRPFGYEAEPRNQCAANSALFSTPSSLTMPHPVSFQGTSS